MRKHVLSILILGGSLGACAHVKSNQDAIDVKPVAPAVVPAAEHQTPPISPAQPPAPQITPTPADTVPPKPAGAKLAHRTPIKPAAASSPPYVQAASAPRPALDFKTMEQRLRDTSAIGVFTKLSIKNQVDDLLKAFRGYHSGQVPPTLDELHGRFDGLVLKVVTLVQNDDPTLASSISASRGAIWEKLSNKEAFLSL